MKLRRTTTAQHWDRVGESWPAAQQENPVLARHKRQVYRRLLSEWIGDALPSRALKTDMFAEAFNDEEFVSGLTWSRQLLGIDIASTILQHARRRPEMGALRGYVACDVTSLPFRDGTFDLVVSDSTLDHFGTEAEIHSSLAEIVRVLSPGGRLILSIDNPACLSYPPRWAVRLWMRLGLAPYFVGVTLSASRLRSALEALGMTVAHQTAILHYPHPDGLVRLCERCARTLGRGKLDGLLGELFGAAEQLGNTRLRYLTGRYLAVDAVRGIRA